MKLNVIADTCCPDVLKQAELPIISQTLCTRPDHLGQQVTNNMFCAGYELGGTDACQVIKWLSSWISEFMRLV